MGPSKAMLGPIDVSVQLAVKLAVEHVEHDEVVLALIVALALVADGSAASSVGSSSESMSRSLASVRLHLA